jgi:hypothetical protein
MAKLVLHHVRANMVGYMALFFALGGVSYAATLAPPNSVNSQAIINGQVATPDLAANAIKADEFCIMGSCVGSKEIANHAVSTSELAAGAVGSAQLASGAVGPAQIAGSAVGTTQLAANAVRSAQVADGSLTGADIASNSITGAHVKDGSLSAADISGGIPPDSPIAWGSVGGLACNTGRICHWDIGRNIVEVRSPQDGVYCIQVNGAVPADHAIVASPYHDNTIESVLVQGQFRHLCQETTEFEVETWNLSGEFWGPGQDGFSFVIP